MTPQAAHKANRSDIVLLSQQIVDYTRPQLFAVWKELNPDGYEPGSKKDLQKYFIERFGQHYRQRICTPVPFAVNSQTPSTASDRQEENFPSTASRPTEDLPQRLSYSRAVQRASDDTDRKRRECEERLIKLERASEAHDRQFEKIKRDQKSLNLVMYNIPEEGERAKNRFEVLKTLNTELDTAVETALDKYGEKDLEKLFTCIVAAERIGKFVADRTKPRPVRLVFSSLIHRHHFLKFSKDFRQAGFRLDDDLTRSQQAERKSLSLDFQSLKTKGYQPYFRGSLLQYYSDNKNHTCVKGKADRIPAAA